MSGQRRRLDAQGWREVLGRFAAAATTVDAFCAREGLSSSSFYRWRERLRRGGTRAAVPHARANGVAVPAPAGFIELGDLAHPSCRTEAGFHVRLELGGGLVLQITRR
jgi:transposase-like protein